MSQIPTSGGSTPAGAYVLGHSEKELARLGTQARLIDPMTRRFFREAGITPGMRVLDVGSGAGHVAVLAAELVGEKGEVLGVDRSAAALAAARALVEARSLRHVSFREGDLTEMGFERPFDAILGRYVLMFQRDPVAMLRKLAVHARPGAVIVFHEPDWDGVRSSPPAPIYDRSCQWIVESVKRSGAEKNMGAKLYSTFVAAGLPPPTMRLEAAIGGPTDLEPLVLIADIVGTILPAMEKFGIATAAEVGPETLTDRMCAEAAANGSVVFGRSEIGAWSRLPESR